MDLMQLSDDELEATVQTALANKDAGTAMAAANEMQRRADEQMQATREAIKRAGGKMDTPLRDLTDTRWRSH